MTERTEGEQQYDFEPVGPEAVATSEATEEMRDETSTDLEQALAEEQARSQGYLEELQRERASFINFRRRTEQERENWSREANAALVFNLLPVLDDFERAKSALPPDQQGTPWVEGLMLVGRKLYSTLELAGVRVIEAVGQPFDPTVHEAVSVEESEDGQPGTVLEEYRKGYKLGERVLRPSMVKIAK